MTTAIDVWEHAEVERSYQEALHTQPAGLHMDEDQVARYLNPPPESVFPLEYTFALLGDIRGATVLDFGCGSGENSLLLARRGARVTGVDISPALIALARQRLELNGLSRTAADFVVGSAYNLPLPDESIDVVVGIAVLHHLDLPLAAREVFRVLKHGGRAIFQEPVRDSRVLKTIRALIPYHAPDVSPFERPLTSRELEQFGAQFHTDSIRAFSLPFVNVTNVIAPLRRHIGAVYRMDGAMLNAFPILSRLAGIRVLELSKPAG